MNTISELEEYEDQQNYIKEACEEYPNAIALLQAVLYESVIENEFDNDIKNFLTKINKTK